MKTIKFLPIFIGMLLSFAACGDEEKEEVNNDPLYQYEVQDLPAVVVDQSHLDGYWIEVSRTECYYLGMSQKVGNSIYYERMSSRTFTFDIDNFDYNTKGRGDDYYNAWSSKIFTPEGGYDILHNYKMNYLYKDVYKSLSGNWYYLNGIIYVHIVNEDGDESDIEFKIISYKGNEMTLRQAEGSTVVDRVFKKFDIEPVNEILKKEKETLDKERENL